MVEMLTMLYGEVPIIAITWLPRYYDRSTTVYSFV